MRILISNARYFSSLEQLISVNDIRQCIVLIHKCIEIEAILTNNNFNIDIGQLLRLVSCRFSGFFPASADSAPRAVRRSVFGDFPGEPKKLPDAAAPCMRLLLCPYMQDHTAFG